MGFESGGGGGHPENILVGVRRGHKKGGVGLRHGHNQKRGILGMGTTCKRWGLKNWRILVTDAAQKGVLGSLFINYLYFFLVNMINWWGFARTD